MIESYNKIIEELRRLFPHSMDIRIEVDTNEQDINEFSKSIIELSKTSFFIETNTPQPDTYTAYRNPFGMIKLNKI